MGEISLRQGGKRPPLVLAIVLVAALPVAVVAFAATVSAQHCSRYVSPPQSISDAVARSAAADVVCVHGGTYAERVTIRRAGVTIINVAGESPIVDGARLAIGRHDGLWNIEAGADYVKVQGFTIRNSSGRGLVNDGSHNRIYGNRIMNTANAGLLTTNWSGPAQYNEYALNDISRAVQANDCKRVSDPCRNAGGWESAINQYDGGSAPAGHNVYRANRVHDNAGEGVTVMAGDTLDHNVINDNFGFDIYLDNVRGVVVENNVVYESETRYLPVGANGNQSYRHLARGIGLADENPSPHTANITIKNNLILNTRDGINFWNAGQRGSGLIDDRIDNNTIVNTWEYGLAFDAGAHARTLVRSNVIVPRRGSFVRGLPGPGVSSARNVLATRGSANDPRLPGEGTFSFAPADYK